MTAAAPRHRESRAAGVAPGAETAFVTLLWPHRAGETPTTGAKLETVTGGYVLDADLAEGRVRILLRTGDTPLAAPDGRTAKADLEAVRFDKPGRAVAHLIVDGRTVRAGQ